MKAKTFVVLLLTLVMLLSFTGSVFAKTVYVNLSCTSLANGAPITVYNGGHKYVASARWCGGSAWGTYGARFTTHHNGWVDTYVTYRDGLRRNQSKYMNWYNTSLKFNLYR